mmetsp:Transcript_125376/g.313253  ORF Transcript_125376/g.313253 Transcript_125376/m.313253 type:complete len:354 (+) Transcript_125376:841-1902(+)
MQCIKLLRGLGYPGLYLWELGLGLAHLLVCSSDRLSERQAYKALRVLVASRDHASLADTVAIECDCIHPMGARNLLAQLHAAAHHSSSEDLLDGGHGPIRATNNLHEWLHAVHLQKLRAPQLQLTERRHDDGTESLGAYEFHCLSSDLIIHREDVEEGSSGEALHSRAEGRGDLDVRQQGAADTILISFLFGPTLDRCHSLSIGTRHGGLQAALVCLRLLPVMFCLLYQVASLLMQQSRLLGCLVQVLSQAAHPFAEFSQVLLNCDQVLSLSICLCRGLGPSLLGTLEFLIAELHLLAALHQPAGSAFDLFIESLVSLLYCAVLLLAPLLCNELLPMRACHLAALLELSQPGL